MPSISSTAANIPSIEEQSKMAGRRFQAPKPFVEGHWWYLRLWQDGFGKDGKPVRKLKRLKLAPATEKQRKVRNIVADLLQPINQGLVTIGAAVNFADYVTHTYLPTVLISRPKSVREAYKGKIDKYLLPTFRTKTLGEMTNLCIQAYFSALPAQGVPFPTIVKVRDALSHVVRSAVKYKHLAINPMDGLELPDDVREKQPKPFIYPAQFQALLELIPEPYCTMVYLSVWTGLRVSELIGLKWANVGDDNIQVLQRYFRGDWGKTKTSKSAATIWVDPVVIARIYRLKTLTVDVRAGLAMRHYKVVKSDGPSDLVFQSVKDGKPMRDGNVLKRFIHPAAKKLNLQNVNWRCLRTSCATWMVRAGADPKSVQGQMRHSRISTTMEIYAQFVPEGQRRAVQQMSDYARRSILEAGTEAGTVLVQ